MRRSPCELDLWSGNAYQQLKYGFVDLSIPKITQPRFIWNRNGVNIYINNSHSQLRMDDRQAIESELHMCVDELRMLQARTVREPDFRTVFAKLVSIVGQFYDVVDGGNPLNTILLQYQITMIHYVLTTASHKVQNLKLTDRNDWGRVVDVVKELNAVMKALATGSAMINKSMEKVCNAIVIGTSISEQSENDMRNLLVSRNPKMLGIVFSIGTLLDAEQKKDPTFYDFLGAEGKLHMKVLIAFLTQRY